MHEKHLEIMAQSQGWSPGCLITKPLGPVSSHLGGREGQSCQHLCPFLEAGFAHSETLGSEEFLLIPSVSSASISHLQTLLFFHFAVLRRVWKACGNSSILASFCPSKMLYVLGTVDLQKWTVLDGNGPQQKAWT